MNGPGAFARPFVNVSTQIKSGLPDCMYGTEQKANRLGVFQSHLEGLPRQSANLCLAVAVKHQPGITNCQCVRQRTDCDPDLTHGVSAVESFDAAQVSFTYGVHT